MINLINHINNIIILNITYNVSLLTLASCWLGVWCMWHGSFICSPGGFETFVFDLIIDLINDLFIQLFNSII